MSNKHHIVCLTALIKNQAGDRFLIAKRRSDEIAFPSKWAFPGGKMERGERVIEALKREVKEEVGLDITDEILFLQDFTFVRPDDHNVVGLTFLVRAQSDDVILSKDFTEFQWALPVTVSDFDHVPHLDEEVKKAFQE